MSVCDMAVVSILIPLLGAPLLPFLGAASKKIRNLAALTMVLLPLVIYAALLPGWIGGHTGHVYAVSTPALAQFGVIVDGLALVMAFTSALISLIIVVYSFQYIDHYSHQNEYYAMVVIFFGAMMGLVFSSSILYLYVFWEITAVTSWRLIGFFRKDSDWARADKSFYLTVFGALAMLAGFLMIGQQAGTFNLEGIRAVYQTVPVSKTAVSLILLGILAKSATLPLHSWLPDAGVAPSPVTALLHAAVLVKIGVYAYARIFIVNIPLDFEIRQVIMIIAGFSALISAGAAFVETDLKRIIAYSTISQIGFIFLGLASGALIGVAGALLYILMHGLAKGGLFLCAGIIEQNTKTKNIDQMGGLLKTMPLTAAAFLLCAFSVMGIPPLGGFFAKFMVMAAAMQKGLLGIGFIFMIGAFMTMLYLMRLFNRIFMGSPVGPLTAGEGPSKPVMVWSVLTLAALSLAGGIFIWVPSGAMFTVARLCMGLGA